MAQKSHPLMSENQLSFSKGKSNQNSWRIPSSQVSKNVVYPEFDTANIHIRQTQSNEIYKINFEDAPKESLPSWIDRIDEIIQSARQEKSDEGETVSERSVSDALKFSKKLHGCFMPSIYFLGENVRFVWRKKPRNQISLEFFGDDDIEYIAFFPEGKKNQTYMGRLSHENLFSLINSLPVLCSIWRK